jgi:hypothetical protein
MDIAPVIAHLQEHAVLYIVLLVFVVPLLYFTRKYSLPIIFYTLETVIYLCSMHIATWLLVSLVRWFAENSSMKALREDGKPVDAPTWGTPFLNFWDRAAYDPKWLIYLEIALALIIMFLVWRYRPLRIKYKGKKRQFNNEGGSGGKKPPYARGYSGQ